VDPNKADLMLYTPDEAAAVQAQLIAPNFALSSPTVLEYGFLARNLAAGARAIGTSAAACPSGPACNKATITWAFKFPLSLTNSSTLGKFTLKYVVVNEPGSFVVQSLEEQAAGTVAGLTSSNVGGFTQVRTLNTSGYIGSNKNNLCASRVATFTSINPGNVYDPGGTAIPGSLDDCFGLGGITSNSFELYIPNSNDVISAIEQKKNGKTIVAGTTYTSNGESRSFAIAQYNLDGSLDNDFGAFGKLTTVVSPFDASATSLAIQSDGKIIAAGYQFGFNNSNYDFLVIRYNSDGSLDTSFDGDSFMIGYPGNGKVVTSIGPSNGISRDQAFAVSLQTDEKIVVAGFTFNGLVLDWALARYNTDGSLDNTFDGDGKLITDLGSADDVATSITIQSDNKIIVAGRYATNYGLYGAISDFALARYNTNGSLDNTFDSDGKLTTAFSVGSNDKIDDVKVQQNGKIVVSGFSNTNLALARYNTNGSLDNTFDSDGKLITSLNASLYYGSITLSLQRDEKIVASGGDTLARYNPNGSLDTTFGSSGLVNIPSGIGILDSIIQSDGKIVLGGTFPNSYQTDFAVLRYNP
jgi:uncharacterized delta-60 repeat protein